jgi:hypothetical protein
MATNEVQQYRDSATFAEKPDMSQSPPNAPPATANDVQQYGDSATFDPDGYYVPLTRKGEQLERLEHIELRTLEYTYDGGEHPSRPRLLPPRATIVVRNGADSSTSFVCEDLRYSRDSLNVSCARTPIGEVSFRLRLLDQRGGYWRLPDYDEQMREIATGEMSVQATAESPKRQRVSFYYTGGH